MDEFLLFFQKIYNQENFTLRWETGSGTLLDVWLRIGSDIVISVSCLIISILFIYYFRRLRKRLPRDISFYFFPALIFLAGLSHVLHALSFWYSLFQFITIVKILMAFIALLSVSYLNEFFSLLFDVQTKEELEKVTKTLQMQKKKLELANEDLKMFAYVASHDLQEPIRMVSQNLRRLEKSLGNELTPKDQKYINFALDGSARMINMVTDLLEYSSHESDQIKTTYVDLNEVLRVTIIDLGLNIEQSKAQINSNELPIIKGNHSQLLRVFYNLISNSLKYQIPNLDPIINIIYRREFNSHVLSFEDNGRGFEQKDSLKIFQMFKRSGDLTNLSGSGIGLATVKKIVNNHDGRVYAESQPGHGSKFTLVFEIH